MFIINDQIASKVEFHKFLHSCLACRGIYVVCIEIKILQQLAKLIQNKILYIFVFLNFVRLLTPWIINVCEKKV